MMPAKADSDRGEDEQNDLGAVDIDAAGARRVGIAARRLDPVAELGLRQRVAEHDRDKDEPEQRHVDAERADVEIADQHLRQPVVAGIPGALRKAVGDEQRRAARDQKHAERHQEGWDLQPRDEQAVHPADESGDQQSDDERKFERQRAGIEQRPHDHRRQAEERADRQVEFARRHQQRHRQRHEAQLDGERQRVADVQRRQELRIDRVEDDELDDQQHERAEFGLQEQALEHD